MDAHDLRIFMNVANTGSITRAARELHMVQSNVSSRIQALERELDAKLLRRHARGVALTAPGEQLLPYARQITQLLDEAHRIVGDSDRPTGPLRIGSLETTAGLRLPAVLAEFVDDCPEVDLTLTMGGTDGLVSDVLEHRLDGALVTGPVPEQDLEATPVFAEQLVLVTAPAITDAEAMLAHAPPPSMLVFREGCSYRRRLERYVQERSTRSLRRIEFGTLEGILGCVSAGLGITALPHAVVRAAASRGEVRTHPLPDDLARADTIFIRRRDAPTTAALRRFVEHTLAAGPSLQAVPDGSIG